MSLLAVRAALETALSGMSPALATSWENARFDPVEDTPYQRVYLVPADPDDAEMSGRLYWEQGFLQVSLMYPLDAGPTPAITRAELIRSTFRRGATFSASGVAVTIRRTPSIFPAMTEENRFMVPVRVPFSAQITRS